jgi:hypothetical protein
VHRPPEREGAWPRRPNGPPTMARPALLAQLVEHLHGKEGVSGSSPEEGSAKAPQTGVFQVSQLAPEPTCSGYGAVYGAFRFRPASCKCPKRGFSDALPPPPQVLTQPPSAPRSPLSKRERARRPRESSSAGRCPWSTRCWERHLRSMRAERSCYSKTSTRSRHASTVI